MRGKELTISKFSPLKEKAFKNPRALQNRSRIALKTASKTRQPCYKVISRMQTIDATTLSSAEKEQHNWAMICHLSALAIFLPIVPFGNIVGPLVVWLWKRHDVPGVNEHGRAALNFHLSIVIYLLVAGLFIALPLFVLSFVPFAAFVTIPALFLLALLGGALLLAEIILTVVAALKASDGKHYDYPFTLNLIK